MNNNNSLDNVNSLNNILWNIEISYNKQNIVFDCISQLACFIMPVEKRFNYSNVFVILDYEITADSVIYLCIYTELFSNCDRLWRK